MVAIRVQEVHSLLSFVTGIEVVGTLKTFNSHFKKPIEAGRNPDASEYEHERGEERTKELRNLIQPHLLQRKKWEFLRDSLPKSSQYDVWMRLSPLQRTLYKECVLAVEQQLNAGSDKPVQCCVLPAIHRIREICNHPLLYTHKKAPGSSHNPLKEALESLSTEEIIAQSPKIGVLIDLLHKWCGEDCKSLVFSESKMMLDIVEHILVSNNGIQACRIDGSTSQSRRRILVEDFNRTHSACNVMLLSRKAGGEGLTLTGANKSIILDPAWNQASPDQAAARIHRPGQTRDTECIHFITAGTVEEKVSSISHHSINTM